MNSPLTIKVNQITIKLLILFFVGVIQNYIQYLKRALLVSAAVYGLCTYFKRRQGAPAFLYFQYVACSLLCTHRRSLRIIIILF